MEAGVILERAQEEGPQMSLSRSSGLYHRPLEHIWLTKKDICCTLRLIRSHVYFLPKIACNPLAIRQFRRILCMVV